ncbi:hypothetical protein LCGC14_0707380 [marine sediment metagenome]|uniref:Nucleotide modification associated domain-containing protein n=1 Tax=marine sediment metagenome TaxID=412755 RepID=A0A0F9R1F8_9ZZZZ|nr:hypothetical protein [archaeon]
MKLILSRKGFDSTYGGYPSPILPDNTLLSLPIPNRRFVKMEKQPLYYNGDIFPPTKYDDLKIPDQIHTSLASHDININTYQDLIDQLLQDKDIKDNGIKYPKSEPWYCHLDPDLIRDILPREQNWRPLFGQVNRVQKELENQNVGINDLFLFFGWFRKTIIENGKLIYDRLDKQGKHVIFGYLQIDDTLSIKEKLKIQSWMKPHPHLEEELWNATNNTVYVAKPTLSWDSKYTGAGTFRFHENLVLTEANQKVNPKNHRSIWKYSLFPKGTIISRHSEKNWSEIIDGNNKILLFQSAAKYRGQEFVMPKCPEWVKGLNFELK